MSQTREYFARYLGAGTTVIDIGAGNGYIAQYLLQTYGCKMHCADIINYMECDLPFTLITNNSLPFESECFEIAIMNDVLHHMPQDTQVTMLKEATRIAKTVLIVETSRTVAALVLDSIFSRLQCFRMPIPYTHRSSSSWKELFLKTGLEFEEKEISRPWFYPLQHLFYAVGSSN